MYCSLCLTVASPSAGTTAKVQRIILISRGGCFSVVLAVIHCFAVVYLGVLCLQLFLAIKCIVSFVSETRMRER